MPKPDRFIDTTLEFLAIDEFTPAEIAAAKKVDDAKKAAEKK